LGIPVRLIEPLLDEAVKIFRKKISRQLKGLDVPLFELPDQFPERTAADRPGLSLPFDARFVDEENPLVVRPGSLGARLRIRLDPKIQPPALPSQRPTPGLGPIALRDTNPEVRGPQGARLAIVFVHGWALDRTFWRYQMDALSSDYRCLAYNWR